MPVFKFKDENGNIVPIEANTPEEAIGKLSTMKPEAPVTAKGTAQAGATGVRQGVTGLGGIQHDLPEAAGRGAKWLSEKTGIGDPESVGQVVRGGVGSVIETPLTKIARLAVALGAPESILSAVNPGSADINKGIDVAAEKTLPPTAIQKLAEWTKHRPQNTTEEWAQTGGQFLPGMAMPFGGSLASRAIYGTAVPAIATEGSGQIARGMGASPEVENAVRLVAGLASGTLGGLRLRSNQVSRAADVLKTNPGALKQVYQGFVNSGKSPDEIRAAFDELGLGTVLADIDPNFGQMAQQVYAKPGQGRTIIGQELRGREAAANTRVQAGLREALGSPVSRQAVLAELKDRAAALSPEYEAAHAAQTRPVDTQSIADSIESDLGTRRGAVRARLQTIRKNLDIPGTDQLDPSTEGLHEARKAIDGMMYDKAGKPRDMGGDEWHVLSDYRAQIDKALEAAGPIKDVDVKRAQIGKEERAFTTGEEALDKTRSTLSPAEFKTTFDAMTPAEQAQVKNGLSREIDRLTGLAENDRVKLKGVIAGSEEGWNYQKIATIAGEENAQKLLKMLQREKTFAETYNRVIQGSKTAETQDLGQGGGLNAVARDFGYGSIALGPKAGAAAALTGIGKRSLESMLGGMGRNVNPDVAKLLMSGRGDDIARALQMMQQIPNTVLSRALVDALLARQNEVGNR
jgi:hypothetical protein